MSPPLLGVEEVSPGNASVISASSSMDSISQNVLGLKERNYLGLSDCSSVDSSPVSSVSEDKKSNLNLKATELRLGLPGSLSPEREPVLNELSLGQFEEKPLFPLLPSKDGICASSQKNVVSGNKRGFSDAMDGLSEMKGSAYTQGNWMISVAGSNTETAHSFGQGKSSGTQPNLKNEGPSKMLQERSHPTNATSPTDVKTSNNNTSAPAAKAQVVGWPPIRSFRKNTLATTSKNNDEVDGKPSAGAGWPPIRSFRKNTLATTSKNNDEVDGKPSAGALFVKVSMDSAPYLRKVDLRMYHTYRELSSALEKMFSCFTLGQCGSNGPPAKEMSESKFRDLLHGSEYVVSYEDKDGDWMLVGDVPWVMFIESCKRLKIMKGSDAIGLAPRAMEKSGTRFDQH